MTHFIHSDSTTHWSSELTQDKSSGKLISKDNWVKIWLSFAI